MSEAEGEADLGLYLHESASSELLEGRHAHEGYEEEEDVDGHQDI